MDPPHTQDRADLADQLEKRPDTMWRTGTIWSFRNDAKVYGSPVLDAAWAELDKAPGGSPLPAVVAELRGVEVPARMQVGGRGVRAAGGDGEHGMAVAPCRLATEHGAARLSPTSACPLRRSCRRAAAAR